MYDEQSWDLLEILMCDNIWPFTTKDISGLICIWPLESQGSWWTMKQIVEFFSELWMLLITKHNEGIYNTVCAVVLLMLPLLFFFTSLIVCCHFCSSLCRGCDCCCCRDSTTLAGTQVEKTKKKNGAQSEKDLWISVKTDPVTLDRLDLTIV